MEKLKNNKQNIEKRSIGSYLLLINGIFLLIVGISTILGFAIPSINLSGTIGSSLNNWLIYIVNNIVNILNGLISNFKWHNFLDFLNILLILSANILFFIGSGISFRRRSRIGVFGTIIFCVGLFLIIIDLFIENLVLEFPFPTNPNIILRIIDTNIITIIILGFLGGFFSYFKE